jgi:hypothetical protein
MAVISLKRIVVEIDSEFESSDNKLKRVSLKPLNSAPPFIDIRKEDRTINIVKAAISKTILRIDLIIARAISLRSRLFNNSSILI